MSSKPQKFIRSHRDRVKQANDYVKSSHLTISIFDREALVEFFLLEDIVKKYEFLLNKECKKELETQGGIKAKQSNIEKFNAIINVFKNLVEIAWSQIDSENYKVVWKSIHEHQLMSAASSLKYINELRDLSITMLKELSNEALMAAEANQGLNESLDALANHENNVRIVKGLPSSAEIDEIIRAVEIAIPNTINSKIKPNLN